MVAGLQIFSIKTQTRRASRVGKEGFSVGREHQESKLSDMGGNGEGRLSDASCRPSACQLSGKFRTDL